jgi:hypothetical protein
MSINFLLFWGERNRALWQQLLVGEIEKSAERFALLEKLGAAPQELFVTAVCLMNTPNCGNLIQWLIILTYAN